MDFQGRSIFIQSYYYYFFLLCSQTGQDRGQSHLVVLLLGLGEVVGELLVRGLGEVGLRPEVGGEVAVGLADSVEGGLDEVAHGLGLTPGGGVAVLDTSELENLLGGGGGHKSGTAGGGDQADGDGARLSGDLLGDGVGVTDLVSPVAAPDGDDGELGGDDGTADGVGDFLGALDTETNVTIGVTDGNEGLEAGALTGAGLLLNGHDLHDLILELGQEDIDDLVLLDGEGEKVDVLNGLDPAVPHQATELGDGNPGLLLISSTASTTATASTATATTIAALTVSTPTAPAVSTVSTTTTSAKSARSYYNSTF